MVAEWLFSPASGESCGGSAKRHQNLKSYVTRSSLTVVVAGSLLLLEGQLLDFLPHHRVVGEADL